MKTIEIEVVERALDFCTVPDLRPVPREHGFVYKGLKHAPKYHACIKDELGVWACGVSPDAAVGDLIRAHPERFGIKITHLPGKLPR